MFEEDKVFYPRDAGFTKKQVLEMIEERRTDVDEFKELRAPDPNKLTDERMQKFVEDWHNASEEAFDDEYPDMGEIALKMERHLELLAKAIQVDA